MNRITCKNITFYQANDTLFSKFFCKKCIANKNIKFEVLIHIHKNKSICL